MACPFELSIKHVLQPQGIVALLAVLLPVRVYLGFSAFCVSSSRCQRSVFCYVCLI